MEQLAATFHLDWRLLLAQLVNFGLVFSVLYFFAFKPLFKIVGERNSKIEAGLAAAEANQAKLERTNEESRELLKQAKVEANQIVAAATAVAKGKQEEMVAKAKQEIGSLISQEKIKMAQEKNETLKEIRGESAALVIKAVRQLLPELGNAKLDEKAIQRLLKS